MYSKEDIANQMNKWINATLPFMSEGKARIRFGTNRAKYSLDIQEFEGFSRVFLGVIPLLIGGSDVDQLTEFIEGIRNGINSNHKEYWGKAGYRSQRIVEMVPFAILLLFKPEALLDKLDIKEREQLFAWLYQALQYDYPQNNWQFFVVLLSVSLKNNAQNYDKKILDKSLNLIETFYLGDGWYSDGITTQRDYYISYAFHFYGMIYAKFAKDDDPMRAKVFNERAMMFGKDFIYFFDEIGRSIPFGRSLSYRIAQTAFYSGCLICDIYPLSIGQIKGIIYRNIDYWSKLEIVNHDRIFTIGWGYENLNVAEDYNSQGSPYWIFKGFFFMALEDSHPFWKTIIEPLPIKEKTKPLPHAFMLAHTLEDESIIYPCEQYVLFEPGNVIDKYCKFAYSSKYTFNISLDNYTLPRTAIDSQMGIVDESGFIILRRKTRMIYVNNKEIQSIWEPYDGVSITTTIQPMKNGHRRIHQIKSNRLIRIVEGGFPLVNDNALTIGTDDSYVTLENSYGYSSIININGNREVFAIQNPPNANLMFPDKTMIPVVMGEVNKGETTWISEVIGNNGGQ